MATNNTDELSDRIGEENVMEVPGAVILNVDSIYTQPKAPLPYVGDCENHPTPKTPSYVAKASRNYLLPE